MKQILLFLSLFVTIESLNAQITANGNSGQATTAYTNGAANDPIFIWCSNGLATQAGSLTATPPAGAGPFTFEWYFHNQTTSSWAPFSTQNGMTSTISSLASDGYRVEIFNSSGVSVACDIVWVWNMNSTVTANNAPTACNAANLTGAVSASNFVYYNPPPAESIINASTQITVCFNALHTWVSDLGFYLVGPVACGSPTVLLSPNPGANGQGLVCNSGDNVVNLCFTTTPSANLNVCAPAPATLSGTYSSYGAGNTPINWAPLIGCNAAQGGWRVQIYDCVGGDIGLLTSASISFSNLTSTCGSPTTITYNSGAIASVINDNTCSAATASIFQVPPPANLSVAITLNPTVTYAWTASPAATISNSSILNPSVTNLSNGTTTLTLTATITYGATSCTNSANTSITTNFQAPTFTQIAPICAGTNFTLPTTSTNGVNGTWSPAINNLATTTYTFTPAAGLCANTTTMTVDVNPQISPTFDPIPGVCVGAPIAALPTTSLNGITGTWSPAVNNAATTTYTFAPTAGLCATQALTTIAVNLEVLPTFLQVAQICSGEVLNPLPTTSQNGINGTWSPALNNASTTTYTFTPDLGACALNATMTIVVNPNIIPTFNAIPALCSGDVLNPLPTLSLNGIDGTWSPTINNLTTTIYTFTPTAVLGACNLETNLTITVNPLIEPLFAQVGPICSGAALNLLTTSTNGINGNWSPASNNLATTTYTFSPTSGLCPTTTTMTVAVDPNILPEFDQVLPICAGALLLPLPTLSNNGITGSWSPAINNGATTTYTFSPSAGLCALQNTMTITVNPNITPTFDPIPAICEGATLTAFPTTSLNGLDGSWSPIPNNTATTLYTFTPIATPNQCLNSTTLSVTVNPNIVPTFNQLPDICLGEPIGLFPTTSTNGYTGSWSPIPNELATTTYTFDPDPSQCALETTMQVNVNPLPIADFIFTQEIGCAPIDATFTNTSMGALFYQWTFGNGQSSILENPTFTYLNDGCFDVSLTATSNLGCSAVLSLNDLICVTPQPEAFFTSSTYTLSEDELTNNFFNQSENANIFSWDFGDGSEPVVAYDASHTFPILENSEFTVTLTAMNDVGCIDTFSYTYELAEQLIYFVPNTFTPDGDEYNHTFLPVFTSGFNPLAYNFKIFNRWGEIVFESNNPNVGWDGYFKNGPAKTGSYNWVIEFEGIEEFYGSQKISGVVNLLR